MPDRNRLLISLRSTYSFSLRLCKDFFEHSFITRKPPDPIVDFYSTEEFLQILGIFPFAISFVLAGVKWEEDRENAMNVWNMMNISFDITDKEEEIDGETVPVVMQAAHADDQLAKDAHRPVESDRTGSTDDKQDRAQAQDPADAVHRREVGRASQLDRGDGVERRDGDESDARADDGWPRTKVGEDLEDALLRGVGAGDARRRQLREHEVEDDPEGGQERRTPPPWWSRLTPLSFIRSQIRRISKCLSQE